MPWNNFEKSTGSLWSNAAALLRAGPDQAQGIWKPGKAKKQRGTCLCHSFGSCCSCSHLIAACALGTASPSNALNQCSHLWASCDELNCHWISTAMHLCKERGSFSQHVQPQDPVVPINSYVLILLQSLLPSLNSKQADKGSDTG